MRGSGNRGRDSTLERQDDQAGTGSENRSFDILSRAKCEASLGFQHVLDEAVNDDG